MLQPSALKMKRCGPLRSAANPAIAAAHNRPNPHSQMGQRKAFHLSSLRQASNSGVAHCSRGVQHLSYKLKNIVFKRKTADYVVFGAALLPHITVEKWIRGDFNFSSPVSNVLNCK